MIGATHDGLVGSPFDDPGFKPADLRDQGEIAPILYFILILLALFGLLFGSLIYSATSGDGSSQHSPTEEEHHEF